MPTSSARVAIGIVFMFGTGLTQAQTGPSLRDIFEAAWERNPQGKAFESRHAEVEAGKGALDRPFPGSPCVGSIGKGRPAGQKGGRKHGVEPSGPVSSPRLRTARQALAEAEAVEVEASISSARLAVAGMVRDLLWTIFDADVDVNIALRRVDVARKLAADVSRRVERGELALIDELQAQQETASALAMLVEAGYRREELLSRYSVLTGTRALPDNPEETIHARPEGAAHPHLDAARYGVLRAQAKARVAEESPCRDESSIRAAHADAAAAATMEMLARSATDADIKLAAFAMESAAKLLDLSVALRSAAKDYAHLIREAVDRGERPAGDALRANAAAQEAELTVLRAGNAVFAARARLNQARGVLP